MAPNMTEVAEEKEKSVSCILIYIAMEGEAAPVIESLDLKPQTNDSFPPGARWQLYSGKLNDVAVHLVTPGKCQLIGVDNVGTVPAAVTVYALAHTLKPDVIVNAGTAGGFKAKGAEIGDVFLASHFANHDRRIPLPGFDKYGVGLLESTQASQLAHTLGFKVGRVSSGNSLDMSDADRQQLQQNDATIKDMEAAAVAWVASWLGVPVVAVKAVTDIVDGDRATADEFLENFAAAGRALQTAVPRVVQLLAGQPLLLPA